MTFFHPSDTRGEITPKNIENFALKYFLFLESDQGNFKVNEQGFSNKKFTLSNFSSKTQRIIQHFAIRQEKQIQALNQTYKEQRIRAKVDWRMVVGLGSAHVQETSMLLHHVYGIPYIPGSALKGVIRHYFVSEVLAKDCPDENLSVLDNILSSDIKGLKEKEEKQIEDSIKYKRKNADDIPPKKETITKIKSEKKWENLELGQRIFGTQDSKGKVIFMDAFPTKDVTFAMDIMNVHYPDYYKEGSSSPPADYQSPNPVNFLTVEETEFRFIFLSKKQEYLNKVMEFLKGAFEFMGIGAKTAVGYGYFDTNEKKLIDETEIANQKKKEECLKKEREEAERKEKERLANLSPIEQLCEKIKKLGTTQEEENKSYEIYRKLDKFTNEEQKILAKSLKEYWKKIGKLDNPSKKQKKKNKKIKNILAG